MLAGLLAAAAVAGAAPLLNISTAASWPPVVGDLHMGDVRARVVVPETGREGRNATTQVQLWWRRRDAGPENKGVVVLDEAHRPLLVRPGYASAECGVYDITHQDNGRPFYVYYLAYHQTQTNGAHLHFHWANCTEQDRVCVLNAAPTAASCEAVLPGAAYVTGLENRPASAAQKDRTPDGHVFHGFTPMELVATRAEVAAVHGYLAAQNRTAAVYMQERARVARLFDSLPALWARAKETAALEVAAAPGEFLTYQVGVYAGLAAVDVAHVEFTPLAAAGGAGPPIPENAQTCFNLGGVGADGAAFTKPYGVQKGRVGVLWMGVDVPAVPAGTVYRGVVRVVPKAGAALPPLAVTVRVEGAAVGDHGAEDIYSLARLRWLNSRRGHDATPAAPYSPVRYTETAEGAVVYLLNKDVTIGAAGLPLQAAVRTTKTRFGKEQVVTTDALAAPVEVVVVDSTGADVVLRHGGARVDAAAATAASVSWAAVSRGTAGDGKAVEVEVRGTVYFDSLLNFEFTVRGEAKVRDIRLEYTPNGARYMAGWGHVGSALQDTHWKWTPKLQSTGVWVGAPDSGVHTMVKGNGTAWDNPRYSADYPVIPSRPTTWGGVTRRAGKGGGSVKDGRVAMFSGPRQLSAAEADTFLFDMIFTPAKPRNFAKHVRERKYQVGYHTDFLTPEAVHAKGANVVTIHQGTPGVINGTLVNPYINYPFVPDAVALMENYTAQAHALDMRVLYYYTIRELSNHAAELYALLSLQGEVLLDGSPYTIPQKGYCHDWDCHGGGAYLHEHIGAHYEPCWQQGLADGEVDAAVCNKGASRWFNYYVEGLAWAMTRAPHIDGIYYDGLNFDVHAMRRVKRVMTSDTAAARTPLVDIHTGNIGKAAPPCISYTQFYAHADTLWNGEGFKFDNGEPYWFTEVSGIAFGVAADRLALHAYPRHDFRGMLYGVTQRNGPNTPLLWQLWDAVGLAETAMVGYWEPREHLPFTLTVTDAATNATVASPAVHATTYLKYGAHALVAVASWEARACRVQLHANATVLGFAPAGADAPALGKMQAAAVYRDLAAARVLLEANGGVILTVAV